MKKRLKEEKITEADGSNRTAEILIKQEEEEEIFVAKNKSAKRSRKHDKTNLAIKNEDHSPENGYDMGEDDDQEDANGRSHPTTSSDADVRDRFPTSFTDIPDAKAVFEARKRRELLRASGGSIQPVIPVADDTVRFKDKYAENSRLVRDDDNDLSDEEIDGAVRFVSAKDLLIDAEQERRQDQLEALRLEQGDDVGDDVIFESETRTPKTQPPKRSEMWSDDEARNSSDEETERWEREQIRKAVGQQKVRELRQEANAHLRHYHDPHALVDDSRDRIVDEDMEIEVITPQSTVPSFVNTADGTLKRSSKYANIAQLVEKLSSSVENRQMELKTKRHQIEQYAKNIEENRESITRMAEANIQMERNFQLYQELRFFTDNVLNCLNEKVPLINEIETAIFDLWRTRSDDLTRRRAEERKRRKFERIRSNDAWDSDQEESFQPDTYLDSIAKYLEQASTIFEDTAAEYSDVSVLIRRLIDWLQTDPQSFRDAYIAECIPKLVGPFVRIDLFTWNPLLPQNRPLHTFSWYQAVLRLGFNNEISDIDDPAISGLIPDIIEKIIIPKITKIVTELWDPMSTVQTRRLVEQIDQFVSVCPNLNRDSKFFVKLLNAIRQRIQLYLRNEPEIPAHLTSLVTEIQRKRPAEAAPPHQTSPKKVTAHAPPVDDIQALLAQSQSILK